VADSDPRREYAETLEKAGALAGAGKIVTKHISLLRKNPYYAIVINQVCGRERSRLISWWNWCCKGFGDFSSRRGCGSRAALTSWLPERGGKTTCVDTILRLLYPVNQPAKMESLVSRTTPDASRGALVIFSDDSSYYQVIQDFSKKAVNLSKHDPATRSSPSNTRTGTRRRSSWPACCPASPKRLQPPVPVPARVLRRPGVR